MSAPDPQTLEDMARLEALLQRAVSRDAAFQERIATGKDVQILDLACGACNEAETLTSFFANLREAELQDPAMPPKPSRKPKSRRGKQVKLTGMDIRAREISDAAARFKKRLDDQSGSAIDFEFLEGDASSLDVHRELPKEFDVIFIRHQNLWNGQRTWEEIFHKALEKLSPEGRLIITSYFDREHEQALEAFQAQGGELITTARNEQSRKLPTPGKSVDRHVAMLKRKG